MTAITLKQLEKRWGRVVGVHPMDLAIADKEFLVLLGPSGCGKTTTMRMIAGLEEASKGDIMFDGVRVNDVRPQQRDVAMVFQNYGLYPHLTVEENIAYPLKVRNVPMAERAARIGRAAERVELGALLQRRPRELSGGQRQRVALARAIVRTPRVFLMDEPLSNLDAKLRVSMRTEIKHLAHELGVTMVYVTHDQIEAMTLAHRIVVMREGRIEQVGTPEEVYNRPASMYVAGFIGAPPMNLIPGDITAGAFHVEGQAIGAAPANLSGRSVLGIRPEDMHVVASGGDLRLAVYASELLGDSRLLSFKLAGTLISVRAPKDQRADFGEVVALSLPRECRHWFDAQSEQRIDLSN
jgi:multiple sugar transport system ATP-binding protein